MRSTFACPSHSVTADSLRSDAGQPKFAGKRASEGWSRALVVVVASMFVAFGLVRLDAQRGNPQPLRAPRAAAPIELTGYWVSIVTQDWRWRMVTPRKGDYQGVPITPEAAKVADTWDPKKDEAAGLQCKSYGAAALMSVPGRIHITWQDDNTLRVDTDAGMQTRVLRFGSAPTAANPQRTWQGVSQAQWLMTRPNVPLQLRPAERTADTPPILPTGGSLQVVTRNLRAGYLRKNGVPYSENAVMTEYWDVYKRPNGEEWLTITTQVEDPQYLRAARLVAPVFKKEPDGSKWDPTPCSSTW
jgi:hypothetical protein